MAKRVHGLTQYSKYQFIRSLKRNDLQTVGFAMDQLIFKFL